MRLRKEIDHREQREKEDGIDIVKLATVSDALGHPLRLEIFRYIMRSNKKLVAVCNKDIVENFDYAQATISQHMNKLTHSGLVERKNIGRYSYYYANLGILTRYVDSVRKFSLDKHD